MRPDPRCICVTEISKSFAGPKPGAGKLVLSNVSFDLHYGEMLALTGENGAGKSTLVGCLVGIHRISSGTIEIAGIRQDYSPRECKRVLGVCFQDDLSDRDLTVASQLLLMARLHGASRRLATARCQELLEEFGLIEYRTAMPDSLSGGLRRRLQLATSFVSHPTILLLDEPSLNLDERWRAVLYDRLTRMRRAGAGILLVSHDPHEADSLCDDRVTLHDGVLSREPRGAAAGASPPECRRLGSMGALRTILLLWRRHLSVFASDALLGAVQWVAEPVVVALALGVLLGGAIEHRAGARGEGYQQFLLTGLVVQFAMLSPFFEAAYGGYVRLHFARLYRFYGATPMLFGDAAAAEIAWAATRGIVSAAVIVAVCMLSGSVVAAAIPKAMLLVILIATFSGAVGLASASTVRQVGQVAYAQYLFVLPLTLLSGSLFPVEELPRPVQLVVKLLPLDSVIHSVRAELLQTPQETHLLVFAAWWVLAVGLAFLMFTRRLRK